MSILLASSVDLTYVKDVVQIVKDILTALGVIGAAVTVAVGVWTFGAQRGDKRAEHFLNMRKSFESEPLFWPVRKFVNEWWDAKSANENLPELDEKAGLHRIRFMAAFEDVAFLVNSGQMRVEVAHYMFGYDLLRAWYCDAFWENFRNDPTWQLLRHLVGKMEKCGELNKTDGRINVNYKTAILKL